LEKIEILTSHLSTYDSTVEELSQSSNDLVLQHRAVLALARAGSLDFAWAEYRRYGLNKINDLQNVKLLEDIMGLGARLLKDLYLTNIGKISQNYAKQSADAYLAAYHRTGGYYSGINAATMALLAGDEPSKINESADVILQALPDAKKVDSETLYFIEATRAEAFLLKGEIYKSRKCLEIAIKHDPQNYTAHATTLKQFKMILIEQGVDHSWLTKFHPPIPVHYAGHLFKLSDKKHAGSLAKPEQEILKIDISDAIQENDVGFGYGALAAGADILIAEMLLEEGCDLNILLPVPKDIFLEQSVRPFGADWEARFSDCWEHASSCEIVTQNTIWPQHETDIFANKVAMGKAIYHAKQLSVEAQQLLVWDGQIEKTGTARNAEVWQKTERDQIILKYPGNRLKLKRADPDREGDLCFYTHVLDQDKLEHHITLLDAIEVAFKSQNDNDHKVRIGIDVDINSNFETLYARANALSRYAVPGGILTSEAVACLLVLNHADGFDTNYMGHIGHDRNKVRAYSVRRKA